MSATLFRARLLILSTTAAVAIAACGGGAAATAGPGGPAATTAGANPTQAAVGGQATQAPAAGQGVDACALLTDDEIKAVTGYPVAQKNPGAQGGLMGETSGCQWDLTANEIVPPSIVVGVVGTDGKSYYEKYFKPFNEGAGYELVPGVGDEVWDAGSGVIQGVKGDVFFNLQYLGRDDHELELAKKLVAHL
jgi:hypothetical protein